MIQLFEDYFLDADPNNFKLVRKRQVREDKRKDENKDKDVFTVIGYYQSLDGLYKRLVRECEKDVIMSENVRTLADFISRMSGIVGCLEEATKKFETIPPLKRDED